jgi:hypothetical protein
VEFQRYAVVRQRFVCLLLSGWIKNPANGICQVDSCRVIPHDKAAFVHLGYHIRQHGRIGSLGKRRNTRKF